MKLEFSRQGFENSHNIEFQSKSVQQESRCSIRTDRLTDGYHEANSRFPQYCEGALKSQYARFCFHARQNLFVARKQRGVSCHHQTTLLARNLLTLIALYKS